MRKTTRHIYLDYVPYSIDSKLVIAVASSALFDLREADKIFREQKLEAYRSYQQEHEDEVLPVGVAFPLIRRILSLNDKISDYCPVEVVLLSRNDPDTGLRLFKSIEKHKLDITRAAFVGGRDPFRYLGAFNTCLFLSGNPSDVADAIAKNVPAGLVFPTDFIDDDSDNELRIAFDFDGVLADDSAEAVFQEQRLEKYLESEFKMRVFPCRLGRYIDSLSRSLGCKSVTERDVKHMRAERRGSGQPSLPREAPPLTSAWLPRYGVGVCRLTRLSFLAEWRRRES